MRSLTRWKNVILENSVSEHAWTNKLGLNEVSARHLVLNLDRSRIHVTYGRYIPTPKCDAENILSGPDLAGCREEWSAV